MIAMKRPDLHSVRKHLGWTQEQTAEHLCVSQTLVSMVENGRRALTNEMLARLMAFYEVDPTQLPYRDSADLTDADYAGELTKLGYPGFAHRRDQTEKPQWNPVQLAVKLLSADNLDRRVAEALPWLLLRYSYGDWTEALNELKVQDLQNRLGFVVTLAREVTEKETGKEASRREAASKQLGCLEAQAERSRLVRQDTFCNEHMTQAERRWLQNASSPQAQHWNLLCDLRPEHLAHVA
jgi:transcriptional regulator with XRE-family HTH domain